MTSSGLIVVAALYTTILTTIITFQAIALFICALFITLSLISAYSFNDVFITDKRLLISKFNKLISIDFDEINYILCTSYRAQITYIGLKSQKTYFLNYIDGDKFREFIKDINPKIEESAKEWMPLSCYLRDNLIMCFLSFWTK